MSNIFIAFIKMCHEITVLVLTVTRKRKLVCQKTKHVNFKEYKYYRYGIIFFLWDSSRIRPLLPGKWKQMVNNDPDQELFKTMQGEEICDDWWPLSGQEGEGREGMLHLVLSMQVNFLPALFRIRIQIESGSSHQSQSGSRRP